ncbi:MAG: hypothetical protein M3230_01145, partial [Thermoproteota archaeon]|nr:hypothetical protein [Thermoproteota archaeon]
RKSEVGFAIIHDTYLQFRPVIKFLFLKYAKNNILLHDVIINDAIFYESFMIRQYLIRNTRRYY